MVSRILAAGVILALACISTSLAQAAIRHQIDIPQQQLGTALAELAQQTRIQVVYPADLVKGTQLERLEWLDDAGGGARSVAVRNRTEV